MVYLKKRILAQLTTHLETSLETHLTSYIYTNRLQIGYNLNLTIKNFRRKYRLLHVKVRGWRAPIRDSMLRIYKRKEKYI